MPHYRKKPIVIEARQWDGTQESGKEIVAWTGSCFNYVDGAVFDKLHNSWISCEPGDWIICGPQGEFYPIKADMFANTYDLVEPALVT